LLHPNPTLGWDAVKDQRLEVRIVPGVGIHGECIRNGNGQSTARVIEQVIERRELESRRTRL